MKREGAAVFQKDKNEALICSVHLGVRIKATLSIEYERQI